MSAIDRLVFDHQTVVGETYDFGARRTEVALVAIGSAFRFCRFRNFTNVAISFAASLERTVYQDCEFENVRFFRPLSANYELRRCRFINCTFGTWFTDKADVIDCSFTGVIKRGVMAARTGPAAAANVITGNDFSGVRLHDFGFRCSCTPLRGLKMDIDEGQQDVFLSRLGVPRKRQPALLELERLLTEHAS